MKKSGWQGAANPFVISMERSNENALNINSYHWTKLDIHKGDGPSQLAMFNDYDVPSQIFTNLLGKQTGDKVAQKSLTGFFESEFRDMSTKLDEFDSLTRDVHKVNTDEYLEEYNYAPNKEDYSIANVVDNILTLKQYRIFDMFDNLDNYPKFHIDRYE